MCTDSQLWHFICISRIIARLNIAMICVSLLSLVIRVMISDVNLETCICVPLNNFIHHKPDSKQQKMDKHSKTNTTTRLRFQRLWSKINWLGNFLIKIGDCREKWTNLRKSCKKLTQRQDEVAALKAESFLYFYSVIFLCKIDIIRRKYVIWLQIFSAAVLPNITKMGQYLTE